MTSTAPVILHATTVSLCDKGVLIVGASGSGKSSLALQLMALGAALVADDRTVVSREDNHLIASAPPALEGLIEARGVGILPVQYAGPPHLALAIDLNPAAPDRLPHPHKMELLKVSLPCLWHVPAPHFAPAVLQYCKGDIGPPR